MNGWQALGFDSYQEYLESYIWKDRQKLMLKMYPKCYKCRKKATCVHHKTYKNVGEEKQRDLLTLCWSCHEEVHKNG
jgi:5-methylcytosine-specific restriction endonuclease McrA